jgi:hypothetical protein
MTDVSEDYSVLVVGDSWARAREGDTKEDKGWPYYMGIREEFRQGVNGSTAEQWASNKDGMLSKAAGTQADIVILSLLGNDARAALADGKVSPEEFSAGLRNLREVVDTLSRTRDEVIVILYADPFSGQDKRSKIALPLINGAIRMACSGLPVTFADTSKWLNKRHFVGRDIHPTKAGHKIIAKKMMELVDGLDYFEVSQ